MPLKTAIRTPSVVGGSASAPVGPVAVAPVAPVSPVSPVPPPTVPPVIGAVVPPPPPSSDDNAGKAWSITTIPPMTRATMIANRSVLAAKER